MSTSIDASVLARMPNNIPWSHCAYVTNSFVYFQFVIDYRHWVEDFNFILGISLHYLLLAVSDLIH
jgi:hypothetical protein